MKPFCTSGKAEQPLTTHLSGTFRMLQLEITIRLSKVRYRFGVTSLLVPSLSIAPF